MNPEFWHARWEKNEIGFHQVDVNPYLIRHVDCLGAAPGDAVFVPLCGKSLDLAWLAASGHRVVGVELSPVAVDALFTESGLVPDRRRVGAFEHVSAGGIEILIGDFFKVDRAMLHDARAAYDRAALIALPPEARPRYARRLAELLPPGARMLLVSIDYAQEEMSGPPFSVPDDEVRRLFAPAFGIELLEQGDVLEKSPRFAKRGLTHLVETVYSLVRT